MKSNRANWAFLSEATECVKKAKSLIGVSELEDESMLDGEDD
jgi:hypothetical protein